MKVLIALSGAALCLAFLISLAHESHRESDMSDALISRAMR